MRIALVASLVSPILAAGANGPHSVIIDLAHGLRARGHRVTVYAAAGSAVDDLPVIEVPAEAAAAAARVRVSEEVEQDALEALDRAFRRLFARLRQDAPDVISQHAFDASAIELAEGLPILHTLHLPPVDPRLVAAVRATAAPLATVSRATAEAWQRAGTRDLLVLRNGVPRGAPLDMPVRPVALVAGRISPEKGTAAAIRVARRAGLDVLIVGDVYDEDYHRNEVEPLLGPGEWIGPVPRRTLSGLMARSAVLIMPVRWEEAIGLVAAEAQMAGCPVVAYRRGALPEVVAQGVGGLLVDPDDEDALVEAVRASGELDRSIIRARAERELGVESMVGAYDAALRREATGSARRRSIESAVGSHDSRPQRGDAMAALVPPPYV